MAGRFDAWRVLPDTAQQTLSPAKEPLEASWLLVLELAQETPITPTEVLFSETCHPTTSLKRLGGHGERSLVDRTPSYRELKDELGLDSSLKGGRGRGLALHHVVAGTFVLPLFLQDVSSSAA